MKPGQFYFILYQEFIFYLFLIDDQVFVKSEMEVLIIKELGGSQRSAYSKGYDRLTTWNTLALTLYELKSVS